MTIGGLLASAVAVLFTIVAIGVLVLVIGASEGGFAPYQYKFEMPVCLSAAIACVLICAAILAIMMFEKASDRAFYSIILIASIMLLILQFIIVASISYVVTWDPGTLLAFAQAVAAGEDVSQYAWYFNLFPNNNLLTVLLVGICKVFPGSDSGVVAGFLGAALVNTASWLTAVTTKRITGSTGVALFCWGLLAVLSCISPWISIPYSDTYSIVFVALALFALSLINSQNSIIANVGAGLAFGMSMFIGGMIKPTILLIVIAATITYLIYILGEGGFGACKWNLAAVFGLGSAAIIVFGFISPAVQDQIDEYYVADHEQAISYAHYLMMGANPEYYGYFSFEDYEFSRSIESYSDRQAENLAVFKQRIKDFGLAGYAVFVAKKVTVVFNDGTFNFGGEGQSLPPDSEHLKPNPFGSLSNSLRNLMYFSSGKPNVFKELLQITWIAVLILLPFSPWYYRGFAGNQPRAKNAGICLMMSVMGLVIFLMLFEARSRYLYCCLPLFAILASSGACYIKLRIQELIRK